MVAPISSSTVNNWSESLFNKLDTKKQGYVDQSDLASALGTDEAGSTANQDDAAAMLKQIDGDNDGKVTKSELTSAIGKVADELNAQFDSSRVDKSQAMPTGATRATGMANIDEASADEEDDGAVAAAGSASSSSAAGASRAAPAGGTAAPAVAASSTESTNKYVQAADTDTSGDVSDDEAAAYKKLMAKQAEAQASTRSAEKSADKSDKPVDGADKDLARALDMLKQYVDNSGASSSNAATSTVDTSA